MKRTIEENKKSILTDYLHQLESELNNLFHCIEEDEEISEDQFRLYEKRIEKLFSIYNEIDEEIRYS